MFFFNLEGVKEWKMKVEDTKEEEKWKICFVESSSKDELGEHCGSIRFLLF